MLRVAFELLGQAHLDQALLAATHHLGFALHDAHQQAATRGAYGADARLDGGDAGDQLFVRYETNELLLCATTAFERGHRSRECRYFDEVASLHRLVVTRLAINRDLLLHVAVDAKTHVQIDFSFGRCLLREVAVASGAVDPGADVRRMVEAHVRGLAVVVNAYPGYVFPARLIGSNLLDLRTIGGDRLMAAHADSHAGNARLRALIHSNVAKGARQPLRQMHFVGVGDRLHRVFRMDVDKVLYGCRCAGMRRGENTGGHIFRWPRGPHCVAGKRNLHHPPGTGAEQNYQQPSSPTPQHAHSGQVLAATAERADATRPLRGCK